MPEDKEPHGNSKKSKKEQHLYEIVDTDGNKTVKYGISGSKLNKDGSSKRSNYQVYILNKLSGFLKYMAKVLKINIKNREEALKIEQEKVNEYASKNGGSRPRFQTRPSPKNEDNNKNEKE